jgi:hypothetical protein
MHIYKILTSRQLGQNWIDRSIRGNGNRAARRAFITASRQDRHLLENLSEPIACYSRIVVRGAILTQCCISAETARFAQSTRSEFAHL